jgi:transposase-like protein
MEERFMASSCKHARTRRFGFYKRKCDGRTIQRLKCLDCAKTLSTQTAKLSYYSRHPWLDRAIFRTLCSGVSQRRCAENFGVKQKTIAQKLRRYAQWANLEEAKSAAKHLPVELVQFDDMEAFEHTKCKPLSIAVAVDQPTRRILSIQVSQMPAKGLLAAPARKKYGRRDDLRPEGWARLFQELKPQVGAMVRFESDKNPHYPKALKKAFPQAEHKTHKGRRGCVVGQGELKRGGFDPLFSLNHTCGMIRDNLKTLTRRTWCTVKKISGLEALLAIYRWYHNHVRLMNPSKQQQ